MLGKLKKMVNLKVLRVSPYVSNGVPQSCLDPNTLSFFFTIVFPKLLSLNYSLPSQFFFVILAWWQVQDKDIISKILYGLDKQWNQQWTKLHDVIIWVKHDVN